MPASSIPPSAAPSTRSARCRAGRAGLGAAAIAALLGLAACGHDDDDPPAPPPVESPGPVPEAPGPAPAPAALISATDRQRLGLAEMDAIVADSNANGLVGAARCDVQMVEVVHRTSGTDGSPTTASGVVMLPSGAACPGPYPLVSYSRGTTLDRSRALATPGDGEAGLVASMLASQGYVVAASDYLGYAQSTWPFHPYLHAASEAATNLDLLRATREVAAQRAVALDGRVFLTGYSQGGHAAMATQQLIQARHTDEFAVAAAGHMSGPYDLPGSVASAIDALPLGELGSTYYIPFAVTALRRTDPAIYATPAQFFKPPYDQTVERIFPSPAGVSAIDLIEDGELPLLFRDLITDAFIDAARDPASALSLALTANSPFAFAPTAPTLLCGGSRDPVVDFANTRRAATAFQQLGSGQARVIDVEAEPAYAGRLRDDAIPVGLNAGYHASLVPPLCLLEVQKLFQTR